MQIRRASISPEKHLLPSKEVSCIALLNFSRLIAAHDDCQESIISYNTIKRKFSSYDKPILIDKIQDSYQRMTEIMINGFTDHDGKKVRMQSFMRGGAIDRIANVSREAKAILDREGMETYFDSRPDNLDPRYINKTAQGAANEIAFRLADEPAQPIVLFGEPSSGKNCVIAAVKRMTEVEIEREYSIQVINPNRDDLEDEVIYNIAHQAIALARAGVTAIFTTTNWRTAKCAARYFTVVAMKRNYIADVKELEQLSQMGKKS